MENMMKEVDYNKYCPICEHSDLDDFEDPCNECMCTSVRENTRKPINFIEDDDHKVRKIEAYKVSGGDGLRLLEPFKKKC